MASRYIALLAILLLLLSSNAHAYVIHVKWKDPWHVQEISIVDHKAGSDNPRGKYMASYYLSPSSRHELRFDNEVWVPADAYIIKFLDTRIRDPAFPEGYEGLWLLQGKAWGHANGSCWWMKIHLQTRPPNTLVIKVDNATRIGTSDMYAAFAVLTYSYPEPRPLSFGGSMLSVKTDNGSATLLSTAGSKITSATIVACGPSRGHIHFIYTEWPDYTKRNDYEGDLVLPGNVVRPAAHLPSDSTRLAIAAAAGLSLVLLFIVFSPRKR